MDAFERKYKSHGVDVTTEDEFEESVENIGDKTNDMAEAQSMIAEAMNKVGRNGVVVIDEGKTAENNVYVVEGMQFQPGYISSYFITDLETQRLCVEYDHCKLLLVDYKVANVRDLDGVLEDAVRNEDPIIIIAEDFEQEVVETLVVNKSRNQWKVAAVKAPGSGELKSQYLDDIAILTGATVVREKDGLDKAGKEVLGNAYKVVITKEMTTIVGDGTTHEAVNKRVAEIKNLIEQAEQGSEKEKLNERFAKLSGGVAVIQVGAPTETERREKKLGFEDALKGTKPAVEEDIVIGGGSTLLGLVNEEEKVVRGSLEHAASAAKTFLMSENKEPGAGNPMNI